MDQVFLSKSLAEAYYPKVNVNISKSGPVTSIIISCGPSWSNSIRLYNLGSEIMTCPLGSIS